jgi:hypothetical protein
MYRLIAIVFVLSLLGAGPAGADSSTVLYRWIDDSGSVHFTQGLENVPNGFRGRATPLGAVTAPPPPPPPPDPPQAPVPAVQAPPAPKAPPPPGAPERNVVDDMLSNARTSLEYAAAAEGYAKLGLPLGAKTALDKAAQRATTAAHWSAIAKIYGLIGETKDAVEAQRKADQLAAWERRR